jgi:hypothetical protein
MGYEFVNVGVYYTSNTEKQGVRLGWAGKNVYGQYLCSFQ